MKIAVTTDNQTIHQRRWLLVIVYWCAVAAVFLLCASTASAQRTKTDDPALKPRPVELKTKDGLKLRAFYFPSSKGKEAVPVLLVHEWQGQASPYVKLYLALRDAGCAVLALEYRGHGGSREYTDRRGDTKEFNVATMSKADVNNIISRDMEAAKSFLKTENNEGKLNLNSLVIIGVREGCVIAANWASRDWKFPTIGSIKRGQDVKALVLISPAKLLKGFPIDPALGDPAILSLPLMFVDGSESLDVADSKRMVKRVEVFKKRVGRGEAKGLEVAMVKTSLSGSALVKDAPGVIPAIKKFIQSEVKATDERNAWVERTQ